MFQVVVVMLRRALTPVAHSALLRMGLGGAAAVCSGLSFLLKVTRDTGTVRNAAGYPGLRITRSHELIHLPSPVVPASEMFGAGGRGRGQGFVVGMSETPLVKCNKTKYTR